MKGYPTIKLFRFGKESEYKGPRETDGIVSFLTDAAAGGAQKLTPASLEAALGKLRDDAPEPLVVFFASKPEDFEGGAQTLLGKKKPSPLGLAFAAAADSLSESFSFGWIADAAVAAAHGAPPGSVALLHPPALASKLEPAAMRVYAGEATAEALEAWVWSASLPLVGELTPRTKPRYDKAGLPLVRVALPTDWKDDPKGANYHLNRIRKAAAAFAGRASFAVVKPSSPLAELAEYGVASDKAAGSVTVQGPGGKRFACPTQWDPKAPAPVASFVELVLSGGVAPHVKSEPEPVGTDGGVVVAVGTTFDSVVADDKDVLIECVAIDPSSPFRRLGFHRTVLV